MLNLEVGFMAVAGLGIPVWLTVVISVISLVITVPLSALALFLSGKIFKQGIGFGRAFLAALIVGAVGFVLTLIGPLSGSLTLTGALAIVSFLVGLALYLVLPKLMFNLEWGKGLLVGLVWLVIMLVVTFIIGLIIGIIALVLGAGAIASTAAV
jgi:hypothetical protein